MQITCTGCSKKIRVADSAAGKRVKCPQCATVLRIPEKAEEEAPAPSPEESAPEPAPVGTEMAVVPKSTLSGKKSLSRTMIARRRDEDDNEDSEPKSKRRAADDEDDDAPRSKRGRSRDDEDDDEDRRPAKKRRRDDEDDDDHVDIRRKKKRGKEKAGPNGMAIASMICGICAIVSYFAACGCGAAAGPFGAIPGGVALVLAIVGVILGHIGKTPGSEGFAWTGLITSYITLVLMLLGVILVIILLIFGVALLAAAGNAQPRPMPPRRF